MQKTITTSRFFSHADTEDAISKRLERHAGLGCQRHSHARQGFVLETRKLIGIAFFKATDSYEEFSKVNVVLRMSVTPGKRSYLFTAYPVR